MKRFRGRLRKIALANVASFALQGVLFALLALAGLDLTVSAATAKLASWAAFALQLARGG